MKPAAQSLKHLASRLREQTMEVAALRAALEVQGKRIVQMRAELDLWSHSPELRQTVRKLRAEPPSGNGHQRSRE